MHTLELACAYNRIPCWLYHHHRTLLLRFDSPEQALKFRPRPEYKFIAAGVSHLDEIAMLDRGEDPQFITRLFRQFLDQGANCYAVTRDSRIVAYNWLFGDHYIITNDRYAERQLWLKLNPGDAMFGNGFIVPEFRLKGLFPLLLQRAILDKPQTTTFYTTISRLNVDSVRAHQRIGFALLGTIECQRMPMSPYFWSWRSPVHHRHLLGFGQPHVSLNALVTPG